MKNLDALRSREALLTYLSTGKKVKYLCFWGDKQKNNREITKSCLSQWYDSSFNIDGVVYATAEHYMMAEKARLFDHKSAKNGDLVNQIINAEHPQKAKRLGRMVEGFANDRWNLHRIDIVVRANLAKFSQNEALGEFLVGTNSRILVEASPVDTIWGIALDEDHKYASNPYQWRGLNLLGFALMEVRDLLIKRLKPR